METLQVAAKVAEVVVMIVVAGIPLGIAAIAWMKGDLLNWVHVGMYGLEATDDGRKRLVIRTLRNVHVGVLLMNNPVAGFMVLRAAHRAKGKDSPVLEFSKTDGWKIRNLCRGYASSLCSDVWIAQRLNVPVKTGMFVLTLTRELTTQRDSRLGLTLIPKELMDDREGFVGGFDAEPRAEKDRLSYVRAIQHDWLEQSPGEDELYKFLAVEMGVVLPALNPLN